MSGFQCISSGTISQANSRFLNTKNVQCVCISVATCVFIENVRRSRLTEQEIDCLIIEGDQYYKDTKLRLGPAHVNAFLNYEEVAPVIRLHNVFYKVQTYYAEAGSFPRNSGSIEGSVHIFKEKLSSLFFIHENAGFVFIGLHVAISFWKSGNEYFLFDSHSVDLLGKFTPGGVGRLFKFGSIDTLASFLMKRSPLNNTIQGYDIGRVESHILSESAISSLEFPIVSNGSRKRKIDERSLSSQSSDEVPLSKIKDRLNVKNVSKLLDTMSSSDTSESEHDISSQSSEEIPLAIIKDRLNSKHVSSILGSMNISEHDIFTQSSEEIPLAILKGRLNSKDVSSILGSMSISEHEISTQSSEEIPLAILKDRLNSTDVSSILGSSLVVSDSKTSVPNRKPGRPLKKKRGRRKTSEKNKKEKQRDANKKYGAKNTQPTKDAKKKYKISNTDVQKASADKHAENYPDSNKNRVKKYQDSHPGKHLPAVLRKGKIAERQGTELDEVQVYRLENPSLQAPSVHKCAHCRARLFEEEIGRSKWCCGQGKYNVMQFPPLTDSIYHDRLFLKNPRLYNDLFSFCALSVPLGYHHPKGLSFMKILGRTYHLAYDLNAAGTNNSYLYIDDGTARLAKGQKQNLSPIMIKKIQNYLESCNPYVSLYKILHEEPSEHAHLIFETTSRRTHGPVLGDRPITTEVSAILSSDESERPKNKFCIWKLGDAHPRIINATNFLIEPFQYPLLYPEGQPGWHIGRMDNSASPKNISLLKYTRCLLLSEDRFSRFGPLSETWLIDMFARIEGQRLSYLQTLQKKANEQGGLRTGPMDEVQAAVREEILQDETVQGEGNLVPGKIYLPQSFTGGPRYMRVSYMDAMALVSRLGGPTYFLTFTACGGWEEIKQSKQPRSRNEAHLCNRVFELKLRELMRDITSGAFFGILSYVVWVIEFQMRGLPHAHICFRMADGGPKQNVEIDKIVRADIPGFNEAGGRLRKLVLQHMTHGPCGLEYRTNLPCWDEERQTCTRYFPKPLADITYIDDRGFVIYKRRAENKALLKFRQEMIEVDDRWVVPYNAALLLKYECHANLEIASARKVVKYLFKYISKGSPLRRVRLAHETEELDEIEEYVTKRYVGASDAAWRILEFNITGRSPTVKHLPVHLEGKHRVLFRPGQEQEACDSSTSQLILYFQRPEIQELDQLTYLEFYESYRVHANKPNSSLDPVPFSDGLHYVTRRQRGECVARLFWVAPHRGEQFYLRMLLIRYPCRKYEDLYALGGPECNTFQEAARKLGLANDTREYYDAMEEAANFMTASRLRQFFVLLSTIGCPVAEMWTKFNRQLCEDFLQQYGEDEEKAFKLGLIHIDRYLRRHGSTLLEAGLPFVEDNSTELGREILQYSTSVQKAFVDEWEPRLSSDQAEVLNYVKSVIQRTCNERVMFLDGPGGSGKTLLLNLIAAYVRSQEKVVLCVASSGIAAQNLTGGTTAHSMFRIPLLINPDSLWSLTNGTQRAELIRESTMLIFDEAPMLHKYAIELLDRSLRDLMQQDLLFGGKVVMLAGDFRQIPPIVQNARTNSEIVRASIRYSYVWKGVKQLSLVTSHRQKGDDKYREFLMSIGSGKVENRQLVIGKNIEYLVALPELKYVTNVKELIDVVFPTEMLQNPDECSKRVIVCTLNNNVREVNSNTLAKINGIMHTLYSFDSLADEDCADFVIDDALLHHAEGKGVPKHVLQLKVGSVCMVTRNLNFDLGLVNGTKVIIVSITRRLIKCRRPGSEELYGIPRITFKFPIFPNSPIEMNRRQFPLQLAYAITIHKSQGQTIDFVGLDLRSDPFTHGQLYVALSRVRSPDNLCLLVNLERVIDRTPHTKNIVFRELTENKS